MKMLHAPALVASMALAPVFALTSSPALAQENAAKLTIDSPIEALMANAAAKAVVLKHMGPIDQHPFYGQIKTMSLPQVKPMSSGQITDDMIAKITAGLAAL